MTRQKDASASKSQKQFVPVRPGGQREPLIYDPKGYFVISLDFQEKEIILRHYLPDHTPAHEMRGRGATSMLLGLVGDGLVTQLSHAGYLGEELAKAQTALQFGLRYDQDGPLRAQESSTETASPSAAQQTVQEKQITTAPAQVPPKTPRLQVFALKQLEETSIGTTVDLFLTVTDLPREQVLSGLFLEPDETGTFTAFSQTSHPIQAQWTPTTRLIMGAATDLTAGAILRVVGKIDSNNLVHAEQLVILTRVAHIL